MVINLFFITATICFIIDISGMMETVKQSLFRFVRGKKARYTGYRLKPFDCSLCMAWWCGIIYIVSSGNFGIPGIFAVAMFSFAAQLITHLLIAIKDLAGLLINKLRDLEK